MSATLGGGLAEDVRDLMLSCQEDSSAPMTNQEHVTNQEQVPVVVSEGRSYPVTTVYLGAPSECLLCCLL